MTRLLLLTLFLSVSPVASQAEESPVFVSYGTSNGSLPPEYAWDNRVTIHESGKLVIIHCKGYATEGSDCRTRKGKVTAEAMEAIRAAAIASDLSANPAAETMDPSVGGGGSWGTVLIDGQEYELLWEPRAEDANRTAEVMSAIAAAIPTRFESFMHPD